MWSVHLLIYFSLIILWRCNQTVGCNWTVQAANCIKFTQLNPPITESITIIIATTSYPKNKDRMENFQIKEFLTLNIVSTGDICSRCFVFFNKLYWLWLIGNRTWCHLILSIIILMINPLTPTGDWHVNSYLKYLCIIQQTCNNENNQTYQVRGVISI